MTEVGSGCACRRSEGIWIAEASFRNPKAAVLQQDVFDDGGVFDAGEALVEALVFEGEFAVIHAKEVEEGGVKGVDVDGVFGDVVGKVVGVSVNDAGFDTGSGHPDGEVFRVVVAAVVFAGEFALAVDGATEFAAPDDEGVIEHTSFLEVGNEGVGSLIDIAALEREVAAEVAVLVPATVENLGEANTALGESASHQGAVGEGAGLFGIGSVFFEGAFGFLFEVGKLGDGGLHTEGHLVLGDAGEGFGVAEFLMSLVIEFFERVEHASAGGGGDAFGFGEEEDGVALGPEEDALVFRGKEAGTPEAIVNSLGVTLGGPGGIEDDEGREVFVFRAESVGKPGAEGGFSGELIAGAKVSDGGVVVDGLGVHRFDDAEVFGHFFSVGKEFGNPCAIGMVGDFFKLVFRGRDGETFLTGGHGGESLAFADGFREIGIVEVVHLRLVVEEIHLRGGT